MSETDLTPGGWPLFTLTSLGGQFWPQFDLPWLLRCLDGLNKILKIWKTAK